MQLPGSPSHRSPSNDGSLRWSELSEVLDTLPEVIATFDRDGRLLSMNAAGTDLLGYTTNKLHGMLISDLYPEPDVERVITEVLQEAITRGSWSGALSLVAADASRVETQQRWVAHRVDKKATLAFTLVARPVENPGDTELRNRRECLVAASLGLVHDMNNCLGPITAYADLAASAVGSDSRVLRYLEQILDAAERCASLAARLSDLSRARQPELTVVDVVPIAREIVGWMRVTRPDLNIELTSNDAECAVLGNPAQLHQVVMNLTRNAVESLSDHAGSVTIRMDRADPERAVLVAGSYLRLAVRDDGRGVDEASRARIFDPFYSTSPHRSGLGLAVCRDVVQAHDGLLTIEPAHPRGTLAVVYLPLHRPDQAAD